MANRLERIRRKGRRSDLYRGQLLSSLLSGASAASGFTEALAVSVVLLAALLVFGVLSGRSRPRMLLWEDLRAGFPPGEWRIVYVDYAYVRPNLLRVFLNEHDIPAFTTDEFMGSMRWENALAVGGVKLWVPASQFDRAHALIISPEPGAKCPNCGAFAGVFRAGILTAFFVLATLLELGVFAIFLLLPWPRSRWKCLQCGHSWKPPTESTDLRPEGGPSVS